MASQVYCDMDGVLADFQTAADEFFNDGSVGVYRDMTGEDWGRLQREWPTMYADLKMMPQGLVLWRMLLPYQPVLLTAAPKSWPAAQISKQIWAKRMLPKYGYTKQQPIIFARKQEKQNWAVQPDGTPNILIDDLKDTIMQWNARGGIGIHYIPTGSTLAKIKDVLSRYARD